MDPSEPLGLLVRSFAETDAEDSLSLRLCEACVDVFGAQGGALTVTASPAEWAAVSTPGTFDQLVSIEEIVGEGPIHAAMEDDRLIATPPGAVAGDFPVFSHVVEHVDDATLYAVPMRTTTCTAGVLSLYVTTHPQERSLRNMQVVADAVGSVLLANPDLIDWSERMPFHLATGMVVAQTGVLPDDASAMLRAHAFARSRSLRAVAQDVVDRRLTFSQVS